MTNWWLGALAFSWSLVLVSIVRTEIVIRRNSMEAGIPSEQTPIKPYSKIDILGALGALIFSGFLIYKSLVNMHATYDLLKGEHITSFYQLLDTTYLWALFKDLVNIDERNLAVQLTNYLNGFFLPHRVAVLLSGPFQALYSTVRHRDPRYKRKQADF